MRLLIAVKSCQRDKKNGCHQAIRETWGKVLPPGVDLLFFVGGVEPPDLEADERYVSVADGYWDSTEKMLAIMRYAVWKDYDFTCLCDTDTYLDLPGLMRSGFEAYDYSGVLSGGTPVFGEKLPPTRTPHTNVLIKTTYSYMSGGHGYIVSRLAAKIVASSKAPCIEGEDFIVGVILGPFFGSKELTAGILQKFKNIVAFHLGCGFYGGRKLERTDPAEAVRRKHKQFEEGHHGR